MSIVIDYDCMGTITTVQVSRAVIVHDILVKPEVLQIYQPMPMYRGTEGIQWMEDRLNIKEKTHESYKCRI